MSGTATIQQNIIVIDYFKTISFFHSIKIKIYVIKQKPLSKQTEKM